MVQPLCITKVVLTEYNGSTKTIDLVELGQKLFLLKKSRIIIEDILCNLFSTSQFLCVKAKWESRECSMREIVEFNENINKKTYGIFRKRN